MMLQGKCTGNPVFNTYTYYLEEKIQGYHQFNSLFLHGIDGGEAYQHETEGQQASSC